MIRGNCDGVSFCMFECIYTFLFSGIFSFLFLTSKKRDRMVIH